MNVRNLGAVEHNLVVGPENSQNRLEWVHKQLRVCSARQTRPLHPIAGDVGFSREQQENERKE